MNKGDFAWKVVFGEGSAAMRRHPLLKGVDLPDRLGTPGNSGVAVTRGGLVFIGGGEPYLYAFDKMTGRELWRGSTDGRTGGNPISYQTGSGRQFVVISTSGGANSERRTRGLRSEARRRHVDCAPRLRRRLAPLRRPLQRSPARKPISSRARDATAARPRAARVPRSPGRRGTSTSCSGSCAKDADRCRRSHRAT